MASSETCIEILIGTSNLGITYIKSGKPLRIYVDSDWGRDLDNRRFCTGLILLMLAKGPTSWKSKKQKSVALSTMEIEYVALSEVVREIIYVQQLFNHMDGNVYVDDSTYIYCDNQSAIKFSKDSIYNIINGVNTWIRFHFSREAQKAKKISCNISRSTKILWIC